MNRPKFSEITKVLKVPSEKEVKTSVNRSVKLTVPEMVAGSQFEENLKAISQPDIETQKPVSVTPAKTMDLFANLPLQLDRMKESTVNHEITADIQAVPKLTKEQEQSP